MLNGAWSTSCPDPTGSGLIYVWQCSLWVLGRHIALKSLCWLHTHKNAVIRLRVWRCWQGSCSGISAELRGCIQSISFLIYEWKWIWWASSWCGTITYDSNSKKSVCQVTTCSSEVHSDQSLESTSPTGSHSVCGHQITGKFTTNLRSHLKRCNLTFYKELLSKEESAKEEEERQG